MVITIVKNSFNYKNYYSQVTYTEQYFESCFKITKNINGYFFPCDFCISFRLILNNFCCLSLLLLLLLLLLSELLHLLNTSAGKLLPPLIILFFPKG